MPSESDRPDFMADGQDITGAGNVYLERAGTRDIFAGGDVSIVQGGARDIRSSGDVTIRQGGAQKIEATDASITQGGVLQLRAEDARIVQGGVLIARSKTLSLEAGAQAAFALTGDTHFEASGAGVVLSRGAVELEQSASGVVVTPHATLKQSGVVFLIAQHVDGDVSPMFGTRAAAVFGAAFGLAASVVWLFARRR